MSTVPWSRRWYGVTGHVIGWPRRSMVVYSVVTKRSKTACTSSGSDVVIGRRVYASARSLGGASGAAPHARVRSARLPLRSAEPRRQLVVPRDRERRCVPALDEHPVEQPPVGEPDVREQPPVAVAGLPPDPVADLHPPPQHG